MSQASASPDNQDETPLRHRTDHDLDHPDLTCLYGRKRVFHFDGDPKHKRGTPLELPESSAVRRPATHKTLTNIVATAMLSSAMLSCVQQPHQT